MKLTFEEVCDYAKWLGFLPREEQSRAKDLTQTYWINHYEDKNLMVLYEGPKRILKGHKEPEVCWICVNEDGKVSSIASRTIRGKFEQVPGFGFNGMGYERLENYFERKNGNISNLTEELENYLRRITKV